MAAPKKTLPLAIRNEIRERYARGDGTMRYLASVYNISASLICNTIHAKGEPDVTPLPPPEWPSEGRQDNNREGAL